MATRKGGRKGAAKRGAAKKGGRKSASKSGGRKSSSRRASSSRGGGAKRAKRAPNPAFMKPMQPSEELGAVVGARPMPRTEVTKRIWDYIRKNGLQDQKNRRQINADDRLRAVFGGRRQVSMFEMTKLVNNHLKNT
jgi:upstream activation factor subunit UAF30